MRGISTAVLAAGFIALLSSSAMAISVMPDGSAGVPEASDAERQPDRTPDSAAQAKTPGDVNALSPLGETRKPDMAMLHDVNRSLEDNRSMRRYDEDLLMAGHSDEDAVNVQIRQLDARFAVVSEIGAQMLRAKTDKEMADLDQIAKAVLATKGPVERARETLAATQAEIDRLGGPDKLKELGINVPTEKALFHQDDK